MLVTRSSTRSSLSLIRAGSMRGCLSHCYSSRVPPGVLVWFRMENIEGAEGAEGVGNMLREARALLASLMWVEELSVVRENLAGRLVSWPR